MYSAGESQHAQLETAGLELARDYYASATAWKRSWGRMFRTAGLTQWMKLALFMKLSGVETWIVKSGSALPVSQEDRMMVLRGCLGGRVAAVDFICSGERI
jgi:hypothetical protein